MGGANGAASVACGFDTLIDDLSKKKRLHHAVRLAPQGFTSCRPEWQRFIQPRSHQAVPVDVQSGPDICLYYSTSLV